MEAWSGRFGVVSGRYHSHGDDEAPQTTIDGNGTAGTPHPRQNSHAQRAGTTEDGELPISVVGPRRGEFDAGIRRRNGRVCCGSLRFCVPNLGESASDILLQ